MEIINPIFSKYVNLDSREEMITFLENHPKYFTMNSWNRIRSYANNVKIPNLILPDSIRDKAYDFISADDNHYYNMCVSALIRDFQEDTGYTAGFNGRSGGYLVMYDMETDDNSLRVCMQDRVDESDIDEWNDDEIRARVTLIQRFDTLCDDIRALFIDCVMKSKIETITEYVPRTKTVVHIPEYEDDIDAQDY